MGETSFAMAASKVNDSPDPDFMFYEGCEHGKTIFLFLNLDTVF